MNLYEINSQIENFEFKIDEETGEVINLDELDNLKLAKDKKIENIVLYIKNLKADEKALDDEIKALQARKKAKTNKATYLSMYLESTLGGAKFETPKCKVSYRKSTSVDIEDGFIEYARIAGLGNLYRENVEYKPDKKTILKELKEGKNIPYCSLKEKQIIQIK